MTDLTTYSTPLASEVVVKTFTGEVLRTEPANVVTWASVKSLLMEPTGLRMIQRSFETDGHKRIVVEIQVQHVGPDLQCATATVEKATAEKQSA